MVTAHTNTQTDRQTQPTTKPEGQNWPRVKNPYYDYVMNWICIPCYWSVMMAITKGQQNQILIKSIMLASKGGWKIVVGDLRPNDFHMTSLEYETELVINVFMRTNVWLVLWFVFLSVCNCVMSRWNCNLAGAKISLSIRTKITIDNAHPKKVITVTSLLLYVLNVLVVASQECRCVQCVNYLIDTH